MYPSVVGQQSPIKPISLHLECDKQELLPPPGNDVGVDAVECFVAGVSFGRGAGSDAVVPVVVV
jgi:hypothetical protein